MANSDIALRNLSSHLVRSTSQLSVTSAETSAETGTLDSDTRSTAEAHLIARSTTQPQPQTELFPNPRCSTESSYQPLNQDESDTAPDHEDENFEATKAKMARHLGVLAWWIPELLASLVSVFTLGCIIGVLRKYNHSLVTDIDLPNYLTLNGLIAALATVNRACLNTPVCSALLQQMWLYLAAQSKSKDPSGSRLRDLELYTEASSGVWGSLVFLCHARVSRIAACFGCLITIVSLAFSTFTQQLISIELTPIRNATSPGNLPRSEAYSQFSNAEHKSMDYISLDIMASIHNGMLGKDVRPVQAICPTANCTWPVTPTVAVCGACAESTFAPMGCNTSYTSCSSDSVKCPSRPNQYCNYSLPTGKNIQLYDFMREPANSFDLEPAFRVVSSAGSKFNRAVDMRPYFANFELFGVPFGWGLQTKNSSDDTFLKPDSLNLKNTECALWMCVQAYSTNVTSNVQYDNIVGTYNSANGTRWDMGIRAPFQISTVPAELDRDGLTNFSVSRDAGRALDGYFIRVLEGNVTVAGDGHSSSSDLVFGAWNGSTNASAWISNVAISMTNALRVRDLVARDQYNGQHYGLAVVVRWKWLVLPAALVIASWVYLLIVMFQTAASPVHSWKGSPLTLLLFELDPSIREAAYGQVDKWGGLSKSIGGTKVRMTTASGGIRKFHAV